jgi:hypothetical protein
MLTQLNNLVIIKNMKKIIYLFSLLLLTFCKAQTPIIDLYGDEPYGKVNNAYYKDVTGFLDQYIGTWLYTNGATSLKIIFKKKEQKFFPLQPTTYYADILVGEYQYIENGDEKVNTLDQIDTNFGPDIKDMWYSHNLYEICQLRPHSRPPCNECLPNERRLLMSLSDPNYSHLRNLGNEFVIRRFVENGVTKLKVWFYSTMQMQAIDENDNLVSFNGYSLPFGEYILTKL